MTRIATALFLMMSLSVGCATVKAYEREELAHPCMEDAPWPSVTLGDQHVHEVREGTAGATGNAGGGCGCN